MSFTWIDAAAAADHRPAVIVLGPGNTVVR
jgi:hypothetical protein